MTDGKLSSSSTSLGDVATGHVAVFRRRLAEVVGRAANPCMAPVAGHSGYSGRVHRGPLPGPSDPGDFG